MAVCVVWRWLSGGGLGIILEAESDTLKAGRLLTTDQTPQGTADRNPVFILYWLSDRRLAAAPHDEASRPASTRRVGSASSSRGG